MHLDFRGGMSDEDLQNFAWSAIHNTAIFYNHLKNWATGNEALKTEIRETHQNSQPLLIIRDLDNSNKHPEARTNTSGLSPKLVEVNRVAKLTSSGSGSSITFGRHGVISTGDVRVVIDGDIVNAKNNKKIGALSTTLEEAIKTWEDFLDSKGLLAPTP